MSERKLVSYRVVIPAQPGWRVVSVEMVEDKARPYEEPIIAWAWWAEENELIPIVRSDWSYYGDQASGCQPTRLVYDDESEDESCRVFGILAPGAPFEPERFQKRVSDYAQDRWGRAEPRAAAPKNPSQSP